MNSRFRITFRQTQDCLTKSEEYRQIRENLQNRIASHRSDIAVHENERTHCLLEQKRMKGEIAGADAQAGERAAAILAASEEEKGLEQKLVSLEKEEQLAKEEQQKLLEKGKSYDSETGDLQARLSTLALDISPLQYDNYCIGTYSGR